MDRNSCDSCNNLVESNWRYCRYCGAVLKQIRKPEIDLEKVDITKTINEVKERVEFDKEMYHKILSNRSERTELIREKKQVKDDIAALLEQLESGLISRDYALPKIKEFKAEVSDINKREDKFDGIPEQLPVEILVDQIEDAEQRMKKIATLKNDPAITKEALQEAKKRAEDSLKLLRDEYSLVAAHLKKWQKEVKDKLETERKTLEQLYIRMKTGELTEEVYTEKKTSKAAEISKMVNMIGMLQTMIEI